jgi:hypothetical protein
MNFAITKTKCQYVIMRAGYGNGWLDGNLATYYRDARAQDMPVGLYWYNRVGEDFILHADGFAEAIDMYPPQIDICGDYEQTSKDMNQTLDWILSYDGRLRNQTGKVPMSYTSKGFWDAKVARSSQWIGRRLWDANWTTRDYPAVPLDWQFKQGDHWQWSADNNRKAAEYGSTGGDPDMDLDRYYGSVAQFNAQYGTHIQPIGGQPPPPPPPPPGQVPENVLIITGELAIHNTPQAVQGNIVGHALYNTIWHPYEEVAANGVVWYRVTKDGYISKNYTRVV